ncbi:hypothetical protein RN001_003467 [Aquatica leii]|uniref:Uncharacterized protein n=1 Tax=Aquatica leii TaxID=1421715 RepID=A0AAN7PR58_9COLE|nr:hypothetical protein RN001_003467 [Aquatica leii]
MLVTNIRHRAATTMENPAQIRTQVLQNVSLATLGNIPSVNAMRQVISRSRQQQQLGLPVVQHRRDLVIPNAYAQYEPQPEILEQYLLVDTGVGDENSFFIIGRESHATWLCRGDVFPHGPFDFHYSNVLIN